jgi:hypothetical protein
MTYYDPASLARSVHADYAQWSIEELWQLASQLRVAGARAKNRRELLDLFGAPAPKTGQH